jgi:hypothetical protein
LYEKENSIEKTLFMHPPISNTSIVKVVEFDSDKKELRDSVLPEIEEEYCIPNSMAKY